MARTRKEPEEREVTEQSSKKLKTKKSPRTPTIVDEELLHSEDKLLSEEEIKKITPTLEKSGYYYRAKPGMAGPDVKSDYSAASDGKNKFIVYRQAKENKSAILGHGGMSTVKIAQNLSSGEWVVMKTVKPPTVNENKSFESAARIEVEILEKLGRARSGLIKRNSRKSPNLEKNRFFMEIAKGDDLHDLINLESLPKDTNKLLEIADNFINEIINLHKLNYVHRDIKIENIFVDLETNQVTLIDFGSASEINEETGLAKRKTTSFSPDTTAPEVLEAGENARYSTAADVYSAGRVLLALLFGVSKDNQEKYQLCDSDDEQKVQICNQEDESEVYYELDNGVYDIINQMLNKNPAERPTLEDVSRVLKKFLVAPEPSAATPSP